MIGLDQGTDRQATPLVIMATGRRLSNVLVITATYSRIASRQIFDETEKPFAPYRSPFSRQKGGFRP